jgi:hypothetical protein
VSINTIQETPGWARFTRSTTLNSGLLFSSSKKDEVAFNALNG